MEEEIRKSVQKMARGYISEEVTEEYGVEDGQLRLLKRREVKKQVPPDLKAVKLLEESGDYSAFTDEELEEEKRRLIALWREERERG